MPPVQDSGGLGFRPLSVKRGPCREFGINGLKCTIELACFPMLAPEVPQFLLLESELVLELLNLVDSPKVIEIRLLIYSSWVWL